MKPRLFQSNAPLAAAAALFMLATFIPTRWAWVWSHPSNFVTALLQPVTLPLTHFAGALAPRPRAVAQAGVSHEDYQELLAYNERLRLQLAEAVRTIRDLRGLQSLPLAAPQFLAARVTAWSDSGKNPTLTINVGTRERVRAGWIVESNGSLVGWIAGVPGTVSSRVRLITAPGTLLTAEVRPRGPAAAPPRGEVSLAAAPNGIDLVTTDASTVDQYRVGDVAYYVRDGSLPSEATGLILGYVVRIEPDRADPMLRRRLVVRPAWPAHALSDVMVIIPPDATSDQPRQ